MLLFLLEEEEGSMARGYGWVKLGLKGQGLIHLRRGHVQLQKEEELHFAAWIREREREFVGVD